MNVTQFFLKKIWLQKIQNLQEVFTRNTVTFSTSTDDTMIIFRLTNYLVKWHLFTCKLNETVSLPKQIIFPFKH